MTRIAKICTRAVAVPLAATTAFATRSVSERHYALVEIEGNDGVKGIGYAGYAGGTLVTKAMHGLLARKLLGQDAHRVAGICEDMEALLPAGSACAARHQRARYRALGPERAGGGPAALQISRRRGHRSRTGLCQLLPRRQGAGDAGRGGGGYVRQGFGAVKIKVGRERDLGRERARVAAARGHRRGRAADARCEQRTVESVDGTSLFDRRALRPRRHRQPCAARSADAGAGGHQRDRGRTWRFKQLLDKGAAIILQTDACVCGGISEFRRIAAIAASYGVMLCPHWFHDVHAHRVAATPNVRYVELFPDDKVLNFRRLIAPQPAFANGMIKLPDRPGLGCDFLPEAVERNALEPWA